MKKVHFIGIGGSGMNAAAGIAHFMGYEVSGCDFSPKPSEYIKSLQELNIPIAFEHDPKHLLGIDLLCVSPAVYDQSSKHPEFLFASESNIPVMTWPQFMGMELQKNKKVIAVAGTKGKSTTTALIGTIFEKAGLDPIVQVGAKVKEWGKNYRVGHGEWFICEADEYFGSFLHYDPDIAVITNIEMDHPEYFSSMDEYVDIYVRFVQQIQKRGLLVLGDVGGAFQKIEEVLSNKDIEIVRVQNHLNSIDFEAPESLPGQHNALNISASFAVSSRVNINENVMKEAVKDFKGLSRRFELICDKSGIKIFNDYAHNPMSVKAVLDAARSVYPESRIWAVFQPHMYTRTKMFMEDFANSFGSADKIIITKIFASREAGKSIETEVSGAQLASRINQIDESKGALYEESFDDVVSSLISDLRSGDVVVNMGAGDNGIICELLCERF